MTEQEVERPAKASHLLAVMVDVATDVGLPSDLLSAVQILGVLARPFDAKGFRYLWMHRHLQPVKMV